MKTLTLSDNSNWKQICEDKRFDNFPYRIELSRTGRLHLRQHRSYHSIYQSRIIRALIKLLPDGEAMPECPIETEAGIFVADVAWASPEKVERNFDLASWSESPAIVVEVLSPSNSEDEIRNKRNAIFAKGAAEFWICDRTGKLQFFGRRSALSKSRLCPEFPLNVAKTSPLK
jgi:Uma2 family endonuclease